MMPTRRNQTPDLFADHLPDPVEAAIHRRGALRPRRPPSRRPAAAAPEIKRKAGFYLPDALLDRFNIRFYELKLAGVAVENKSALLEAALTYALDDLDRGPESKILKRMASSPLQR